MPYAPLIFTRLIELPQTTLVSIQLTTDKPAHLLLTHSAAYPVRTPRTITKYGRTRECGFYLRWVSYHTHDQAEPGDTLTHTYALLAADTPLPSWAAAAPSSHPLPGEPATPPFPVPASLGGFANITLQQVTPNQIFIGGFGNAVWDTLVSQTSWPPPPPPLPLIDLATNAAATLDITSSLSLSVPGVGPLTVELRDSTDSITYETLQLTATNPPQRHYTGHYSGPPLTAGGFHLLVSNGTSQPVIVASGAYPTTIVVVES